LADVTERLITSAILRKALREKLRTGAKQETISLLVSRYALSGSRPGRWHGAAPRVPVELVPHRRRAEFLAAVSEIPNRRLAAKRSLATWAMRGIVGIDEKRRSSEQNRHTTPSGFGPNFPGDK